ncbi:MAG: alkaline phosphatase family protein [Prevotellaceae bacterium]|nr:alkaline phosphatase family protein [Prevotellaceae bacterium]
MKKGLITSLLVLTFGGGLQAQTLPEAPRLVVTLTIDQLRNDYLEAFSSLYGEKGFKRLLREGKVYRHAEFPFNDRDRASAIASLYTGSSPALNGIVAKRWFDVKSLRTISCVDDAAFMGNYTDEKSSPAKLLVSTLTDEAKVASGGKALVYAIAPFRDAAILSAGHAANGAFWLNELTGKWCGTTYYGEYPWWMSQYNDRCSPDLRIKELEWTPLFPATSYTFLPGWRDIPFRYKFDTEKDNKFRRLVTSPLVNDEVNNLVEELLTKSGMGKNTTTDFLALTYYGGNFNHRTTQECAMEMQDTYVRLDHSIATLLDILDRKVGLEHVLFCLTSTGYADADGADASSYRIPGGEFYLNRCAALLNMFLMATYGQGQYVEGYYNRWIYLNHKLLEEKQLALNDVLEKAAEFLVQFSGVREVFSTYRLLLGAWTPRMERIRGGYFPDRSGDLLVEIMPGWSFAQEDSNDNRVVRLAPMQAPLVFLGKGVKAGTVDTPVNTNCIAPTLAGAMHIRSPGACTESPLDL